MERILLLVSWRGSFVPVSEDDFSPAVSDCFPCTRRNRSSTSSALSARASAVSAASASSWTEGANLEKRVSSSSGSSTLVMIRTIHSELRGIASIIKGISSASNPNSNDACCIISRNRSFAFSVP